jgi:4a-hydroxytetrahydrobiopterin dehydratase
MALDPAWLNDGTSLSREWKCKNFRAALAYVNAVGTIAEEQRHHPDITFGWGHVKIRITTHDAGNRLTEKDLRLAEAIDRVPAP